MFTNSVRDLDYRVRDYAAVELVSGGLNTGFQYGNNDGTAPVKVSATDGFLFTPGLTLTVLYVSGSINTGGGAPNTTGANGNGIIFNAGGGSTGNFAPSRYMGPFPPNVYLGQLVGTFANVTGAIVGTPFALGNGPFTLTIPTGATQLQFGANDDLFSDNTGSLVLNVTQVPEPSTLGFVLIALGAFVSYVRRRRA